MHDLLVPIADLRDRPGASRRVDLDLPVPEDFSFPLVAVAEPIALRGVLESVVDGILVRGKLSAAAHLSCARCLAPVTDTVTAAVAELYRDPADVETDDELDPGYELGDADLSLDALVRDALAAALPTQPLCRPDCKGLCPRCGADRNAASASGDCGCVDDDTDPRWSALRDLRLPD